MDDNIFPKPQFTDVFRSYFDEVTVQDVLSNIRHFSPTWLACASLSVPGRRDGDPATLNMADVHRVTSKGSENTFVYRATDIDDAVWKKHRLVRVDYTEREDGVNALMWAAHVGDVDYVALLCRYGAYVDRQLQNGNSVLMEAIAGKCRQRWRCVEALLAAGARSNLENKAGHNALTVAASVGHLELVRLLLTRCRFDVNHKTKMGNTALTLAAAGDHLEVVHLLVSEYDADILVQDQNRLTSLCWSQVLNLRIAGYLSLQLAVRGQLQQFIKDRVRLLRQHPEEVELFDVFHHLVILFMMLKPAREMLMKEGVLEQLLTHPVWEKLLQSGSDDSSSQEGEEEEEEDTDSQRMYYYIVPWFAALSCGMLYNEAAPSNRFLASDFSQHYIDSINGMLPGDDEEDVFVSLAMLLPIVYTEKGRLWLQEKALNYKNVLQLLTDRSEKGDEEERAELKSTFAEITEAMFIGYDLRAAMRMIGEALVKSACPDPEVRVQDKLVEVIVYFNDIRHTLRERLADMRMKELLEEELRDIEQVNKAKQRRRNRRARNRENKLKEKVAREKEPTKAVSTTKRRTRPIAAIAATLTPIPVVGKEPVKPTLTKPNVNNEPRLKTVPTPPQDTKTPTSPASCPRRRGGQNQRTRRNDEVVGQMAKKANRNTENSGAVTQWKQALGEAVPAKIGAPPVSELLEQEFPSLSRTRLARKDLQSFMRECEDKPAFVKMVPEVGQWQEYNIEAFEDPPMSSKCGKAVVSGGSNEGGSVEEDFQASWMKSLQTEQRGTPSLSASSSELSLVEQVTSSGSHRSSPWWESQSLSLSSSSAESNIASICKSPNDDDKEDDVVDVALANVAMTSSDESAGDFGFFMPSLHDKQPVSLDLPKLPVNAPSVTSIERQYNSAEPTEGSPRRKESVAELLKIIRHEKSNGRRESKTDSRSSGPLQKTHVDDSIQKGVSRQMSPQKAPQAFEKASACRSPLRKKGESHNVGETLSSKPELKRSSGTAGTAVDCKGEGDSKDVGVPPFDVGLWQAMVASTASSGKTSAAPPPPGFLPLFPNPKVYKKPAISWTMRSIKWRPLLTKLVALPRSKITSIGSLRFCAKDDFLLAERSGEKKIFIGLLGDGTEVAIKRVSKKDAKYLINEKRVLRQNKMASSENIINYVDYVEDNTYAYLAVEVCDYTLAEYVNGLKEAGTLACDAPLLVGQLLRAVQAMHDSGVLHTALKPSDVLIDSAGNLRVSNFERSLTRGLNEAVSRTHTRGLDWMSKALIDHNGGKRFVYTAEYDMQVVGMLVYYIVSGGSHLYGRPESQCITNIQNDYPVCFGDVDDVLLANMLLFMVHPDVSQRKKAAELLHHPYLWTDQKKMNFLNTILILPEMVPWASNPTKDMIQQCDQWTNSTNWQSEIDNDLMTALRQKTEYSQDVSDLLRCMADTQRDYRQLSVAIQETIGEPAVYFMSKFSRIFMAIYEIVRESKWRSKKSLLSYLGPM